MNIPTSVPITISPEAAERTRELGRERELEQMIEHMCRTLPNLLSVEVSLAEPYDTGDTPRVVVDARIPEPTGAEIDRTGRDLGFWQVATFPPQVNEHILMDVRYGAADGR